MIISKADEAASSGPEEPAHGSLLPAYSPPDGDAPSYVAEPPDGEQRLSHTSPARAVAPVPQGSFIHRAGNITITLHDQEPDVDIPLYRRGAILRGEILMEEDDVTSVSLKVRLFLFLDMISFRPQMYNIARRTTDIVHGRGRDHYSDIFLS